MVVRRRDSALWVVLVFVLGLSDAGMDDSERLIGWRGEISQDGGGAGLRGNRDSATGGSDTDTGPILDVTDGIPPPGVLHPVPSRIEQVSWAPRAYLYHNFLTSAECDYMIQKATPKMQKSTVVDNRTGKSIDSQIRTSSGMFFRRGEDPVIEEVERRIAEFSMIPAENGEGIQMLHYEIGQKYEAHYDYFHDAVNSAPEKGGQRIATVLMYLSDIEEGGETVFPSGKGVEGLEKREDWSACAKRGAAVHPKKGDALLFFSLDLNQQLDTHSLHASCPVILGNKWSATKWMHVAKFGIGGAKKARKPGDPCQDENKMCASWAAAGECKKNPDFMIGTSDSDGQCLKACNEC